jgi:hypothetical protein
MSIDLKDNPTVTDEVSEKPILFSTELVQAILDGRKTQTRRVITSDQLNDDPNYWESFGVQRAKDITFTPQPSPGLYALFGNKGDDDWIEPIKSPYGKPSDELWVRETWQALQHGSYKPFDCKPSEIPEQYADVRYKADEGETQYPWKPSIHMPRWASRIQLTVKDIRVERVQDMSVEDMEEECITGHSKPSALLGKPNSYYQNGDGLKYNTPQEAFRQLWDSINADRGYSWESNPWVWVVEFEVKNVAQ